MFTGIVSTTGIIVVKQNVGDAMRIKIDSKDLELHDVSLGDSISVSGVCLTVVAFDDRSFETDVSIETLSKTTLGSKINSGNVNLEKAMKADARLGGHIVMGHIDGLGLVESVEELDGYVKFSVSVPGDISRYLATKGSVCVDGVSLTINESSGDKFNFMTIPHTLSITTLGDLKTGDSVNIEIDIIARYLERLMEEKSSN